MSLKIFDQSEQIKSLHAAIQNQNKSISELHSNNSKIEEQLISKVKLFDEIKELKNDQKNDNITTNILNLLDNEKGSQILISNQRQIQLVKSKARVLDKINQEKFLKEVAMNLNPIEKVLSENNENEKKTFSVFQMSREKLISLLYQNNQLEKRVKETTVRLYEKENKIKKQQTEINEQKIQIDKLRTTSSSDNSNNNTTGTTTTNNLNELI